MPRHVTENEIAMAIETELKLHVAAGQLSRLRRHPFLRALSVARARTVKLYNVYYDTPDFHLRQQGMALRLRRCGKRWLQTLKGSGQVNAGLHQRCEWETPVLAEQLDFAALEACGGIVPNAVRNRVQPVFVTDFSRTIRLLDFAGARIELAIDEGEIRTGSAYHTISELELELKSGEPVQLFRLALALLEIVPLQVEPVSKAEYGYRLSSGSQPAPSKVRFPVLDKTQSAASALQAMISACLSHILANVPGVLSSTDEEYLHQVRVGLRRLRVMLNMARHLREDDEARVLCDQAAHLGRQLGRAREWDVLLTRTLPSVRADLPPSTELEELIKQCERQRKNLYAEVRKALASPDFQRMVLRLGAWQQVGWSARSALPWYRFARHKVQKQHARVLSYAAKPLKTPKQWHALRIACKKLRYRAEMIASLFVERNSKKYIKRLAAVQETLGELHDDMVADHLLERLSGQQHRDLLQHIRRRIEQDRSTRLAAFNKAWRGFMKAREFWN